MLTRWLPILVFYGKMKIIFFAGLEIWVLGLSLQNWVINHGVQPNSMMKCSGGGTFYGSCMLH